MHVIYRACMHVIYRTFTCAAENGCKNNEFYLKKPQRL